VLHDRDFWYLVAYVIVIFAALVAICTFKQREWLIGIVAVLVAALGVMTITLVIPAVAHHNTERDRARDLRERLMPDPTGRGFVDGYGHMVVVPDGDYSAWIDAQRQRQREQDAWADEIRRENEAATDFQKAATASLEGQGFTVVTLNLNLTGGLHPTYDADSTTRVGVLDRDVPDNYAVVSLIGHPCQVRYGVVTYDDNTTHLVAGTGIELNSTVDCPKPADLDWVFIGHRPSRR